MLTLTTKPIISNEQSKALDEAALLKNGIPALALMEEASSAIFYSLKEDFPKLKERFIAVVAGWGNNGGDALALARRLHFAGYKVDIFLFSERQGSKLYEIQKGIAGSMGIEIYDMKRLAGLVRKYSLIIEGLFGVGYSYREDEAMERLFTVISESRAQVVAIDTPSGLTAEATPAVNADLTYSIGFYKELFYCLNGRRGAGRIKNLEISFDINHLTDRAESYYIEEITPLELEAGDFVHKYSKGALMAIGGSPGKLGSIVYSGLAGLKSGAGIGLVLTGKSSVAPMNSLTKILVIDSLDKIEDYIERYSTVVIGPGLELESAEDRARLKRIFSLEKQFILDASFFSHFDRTALHSFLKPPILTPHSGEFARFFADEAADLKENSMEAVRRVSERYHCYLLLKDSFITIGFPDKKIFVYDRASRVAAQAGSGDLLAGLIGGLASQGYHPEDAIFQGLRAFYSIIEEFKRRGCRGYDPDRFISLIEEHL